MASSSDVQRIFPRDVRNEVKEENVKDAFERVNALEKAVSRKITTWNAPTLLPIVSDPPYWDDIRIVPGSFIRPGVFDPAIVAWAPGGGSSTYIYEFALDDFARFSAQLPHSYKEGGDIYVHIHWTPSARGSTESGNNVGWKLEYSWANPHDAFPQLETLLLTDACSGVNDEHEQTTDVVISGTGKKISSIIIGNLVRRDTGTDDTWAGSGTGNLPELLELDFHFPLDTIGSKTALTK